MDEKTAGKVKDTLEQAADQRNIRLEKVIMFGSRSRDDYREGSDVDLLIVSPDFEGVAWNRRPGPFYEAWDYENMPAPEFVCLTPDEFEEKKPRNGGIVKTAAETGVEIA